MKVDSAYVPLCKRYPEHVKALGRWEFDVFEACSTLHESLSGASDPIGEEMEDAIGIALINRLKQWHHTDPSRMGHTYDKAVRQLIAAAVAEIAGIRQRAAPRAPEKSELIRSFGELLAGNVT